MKFEKGDTVVLKSGGSAMTVKYSDEEKTAVIWQECRLTNNNQNQVLLTYHEIHEQDFPTIVLNLVPRS